MVALAEAARSRHIHEDVDCAAGRVRNLGAMNQQQGSSTLMKLARNYGSTSMKTLVQLNPFEGMGHYANHYRECADRLVESHRGRPQDDSVLMPFLTLYRQAYELLLKDLALCIAAHQFRFGNTASDYSRESMQARIGPGKDNWGHSLHRSFKWVSNEIEQLDLSDDELPQELKSAVDLLHDVDPSGTAFRYPDPKLTEPLNIDIYKLQNELSTGFHWLEAVYSFVDETLSVAPSDGDYM